MPRAAQRSHDEVATRVREVARELYALPREEFVAARNDAAAQLKASGETEAAAATRSLRKPTLAAWAINQAVRRDERDAEQLMETVATMQSPASRPELRQLGERYDALVDTLARAADAQVGGGRRGELAAAIRAAPLSRDAQAFVDGCLSTAPSAGDDTLAAALAAGAGSAAGRRRPGTPAAAARGTRTRRAELRRELAEATAARRDARKRARELGRAVREARAQLEDAQAELERAQELLERRSLPVDELRNEMGSAGD